MEVRTVFKNYASSFIKGVLAGICIGLAGAIYLSVKDICPGSDIAGALLFSFGLLTICERGYSLFTGKACYILDNGPPYLAELFVIWVGNFVGTLLISCCFNGVSSLIVEESLAISNNKMSASYGELFILGIVCNIFIYIAVCSKGESSKYLLIILSVAGFVLCGAEHSVANMFYLSVSGMLYCAPMECLVRLFVISAGNVVGAMVFPALEKYSDFYGGNT